MELALRRLVGILLTSILLPLSHLPSPNLTSLLHLLCSLVAQRRCSRPAHPIFVAVLRLDRAAASPGAPPLPGWGPVMGDRKRAAGVPSSTLPPSKQFRTSAAAAAAPAAAAVVAAHPPSDEREGPPLSSSAGAAPATPAASAAAGGGAVASSPRPASSSRPSRPQPASPASRLSSMPSGGRGRRGSGHGQAMAVDPPPRSPDGEPDEFDLLDNGYAWVLSLLGPFYPYSVCVRVVRLYEVVAGFHVACAVGESARLRPFSGAIPL